jgi:curved DNA-binding protein CbpA
MHEVIEQNSVKKLYRKAIVITHPDKVHKSPTDQKFLANRIFGTLNEAWRIYEQTGQ